MKGKRRVRVRRGSCIQVFVENNRIVRAVVSKAPRQSDVITYEIVERAVVGITRPGFVTGMVRRVEEATTWTQSWTQEAANALRTVNALRT